MRRLSQSFVFKPKFEEIFCKENDALAALLSYSVHSSLCMRCLRDSYLVAGGQVTFEK
jgi:hypothetical protein